MLKLGSMWKDITQSLFKRPATELYPFEKKAAPPRLRGMLAWDYATCTGCGLCQKDCPAEAIEFEVLDRKAKQFVFEYYTDRCTFCAQCVYSCRSKSLEMLSDDWELADLDPENFHQVWRSPAPVEAEEPVTEASAVEAAEAS